MKNLILIICVFVVVACGGDKKVDFIYEKYKGNIREIHSQFYKGINNEPDYLEQKQIDSFDINGNLIKQMYYSYDRDIIAKKLKLDQYMLSRYDDDLGLVKVEFFNPSGKMIGVKEFTRIDKNTISAVKFGLDRNYEFRQIINLNDKKLVTSEVYYIGSDSLAYTIVYKRDKDDNIINEFRENNLKVKTTVNIYYPKTYFKINSPDKEGNYTRIVRDTDGITRDIFYYNN
jgi:hypothetical protein